MKNIENVINIKVPFLFLTKFEYIFHFKMLHSEYLRVRINALWECFFFKLTFFNFYSQFFMLENSFV